VLCLAIVASPSTPRKADEGYFVMHDYAADLLAAQLSRLLPAHTQAHATPLAQLILAVAGGSALPQMLQTYVAEHRMVDGGTAQALAGHTLEASGTVVSFGSGNSFGDVSISSVVAGNQVNVTVNLFTVSPSPLTRVPDTVQRAVLMGIASVEARGVPCFISDAALLSGQSPDIVSDEVELLEQAGYVQTSRRINGTRVKLTGAGHKFLRDTHAV
jgi:methylglyoxal synthase